MIHLAPNAATNLIYVQPYQARKFLSTFTHYLVVFTELATAATHPVVLSTPLVDNERYTQARVPTDGTAGAVEAGKVRILDSGMYTYKIYGQNSSSNLDPSDSSVVGVCERGMARVTAEAHWTTPSISIPDNVIYYQS